MFSVGYVFGSVSTSLTLPRSPPFRSGLSLDYMLINCVVQSLSVRCTSSSLIIYIIVHSHSFGSFFLLMTHVHHCYFIMLSVVRCIISVHHFLLFHSFQSCSFVLLVHSVRHAPRHLPTPFPSTSQHLAHHLHCVPVSSQQNKTRRC